MAVGDRVLRPESPTAQPGVFASHLITSEVIDAHGLQEAAKLVIIYGAKSAYMDESGNVLTVKRAFANIAASSGNASIIAAVTGKKLRVLALTMVCGATATDITFQSNNTPISALYANAANGGAVLPFNQYGWLETTAGQALKCTTGAGSDTGIQVLYVEV